MEPKGMIPLGLKMGYRISSLVGKLYCVPFILFFSPMNVLFSYLVLLHKGECYFQKVFILNMSQLRCPLSQIPKAGVIWLSLVMHPSEGWTVAGGTQSFYKVSYQCFEMVGLAPQNFEVFSSKSFIRQMSWWQTPNIGILFFQLSDSECFIIRIFKSFVDNWVNNSRSKYVQHYH